MFYSLLLLCAATIIILAIPKSKSKQTKKEYHNNMIVPGKEHSIDFRFDIEDKSINNADYSIRLKGCIKNGKDWICHSESWQLLSESEYECIEEIFETILANIKEHNVRR